MKNAKTLKAKANGVLLKYLGLKTALNNIVIIEHGAPEFIKFTLLNKNNICYSCDGITLVITRNNDEIHTLYL